MNNNMVMVVEDEKPLRDVYGIILRHGGYEVCEASNGEEALKKFNDYTPKLILLDIFMPVMDGEQFLKGLDLSKYPDTKVVVCSNTADKELIDRMLNLGAEKVITKASLAPSDLLALAAPYFS